MHQKLFMCFFPMQNEFFKVKTHFRNIDNSAKIKPLLSFRRTTVNSCCKQRKNSIQRIFPNCQNQSEFYEVNFKTNGNFFPISKIDFQTKFRPLHQPPPSFDQSDCSFPRPIRFRSVIGFSHVTWGRRNGDKEIPLLQYLL